MDVDNNDIDVIACKFRTMNTNDKDYLISEFKRLSNTQLGTEGCCFYLDLAEWNLNSALWAYYEYETAAAATANNSNNTPGASLSSSALANQSNESADNYHHHQHHHHHHHHFMRPDEIPEMQFVCDITIGEGESVAPNTNFVKTWRIKNSGTIRWPPGCTLRYVNGYNFSSSSSSSSSSLHSSPSSSSSSSTSDILAPAIVTTTPIEIDLPELEPQEHVDISTSLRSPAQCGIYQCQYRTFTRIGHPFGDPIWLLLNVEEGGVLGITQQLNSFNAFGATTTTTSPGGGLLFNNAGGGASSSSASSTQTSPLQSNSGRPSRHFSLIDPSEYKNQQQQQQNEHHQIDSNNNSNNTRFRPTAADEKRPDFYDDMFR